MRPLLDIVTTVCIGLLIGTEFAVAVFINPILRKLGARRGVAGDHIVRGNTGICNANLVWRRFSASDCGSVLETRRDRLSAC